MSAALTLLFVLLLVATPPAPADDHAPEDGYILEGDLVPEEAIPGPGPDPAGAFPTLAVSPEDGSFCYDIKWDEIDPLTGFIIRLGYPEEFAAIEIDFASTPPDEVEEAGPLGGYVAGCIESEPDLLDFIVNEPDASHLTVYSADYPQGAAGGTLYLIRGPGFEPDEQEEEEPTEVATSILETDLVVEQVTPDPPDIAGSGEARLEVTPYFDTMCWDIAWDLDGTVTAIHLHVGGIGEVDAEEFRFDFIKEAREFGGSVKSDLTEGCITVFHVVDFHVLVEDPEGHYVDVHTEALPDGALRGQMTQVDEFDTAVDGFFGEDHHEEEESGRQPVDYLIHLMALLALVGATVFGVFTFRRSRGLYDPPPAAAVATAAVAYALLAVSVAIMLLDRVLAPSGINVLFSDYDRFSTLGLVIAVAALLTGAAAIALAKAHPPLRRVAIALVLGAVVVAVAWMLWVSPEGCVAGGDVEPDGHAPTITVSGDPLDCEERAFIHGDPDESFAGFATPEEAVAGSAAANLGTATHHEGDDWLIAFDGRVVARVTVGSWQDDRYVVFDTEVCAGVESQLGF